MIIFTISTIDSLSLNNGKQNIREFFSVFFHVFSFCQIYRCVQQQCRGIESSIESQSDRNDNHENNGERSKVKSKNSSKLSWLISSTKKENEEIVEKEIDDDLLMDVPPKKKNQTSQEYSTSSDKKLETKKASKLSWLNSTPKKETVKDENEAEEDDDFLGIRPRRKQQAKKTTNSDEEMNGVFSRLDTSNRRNVPKRNVSKQQKQQSDDLENDYQTNKQVEKVSKPKPIDHAEEFLQSCKSKKLNKKQDDDSLDFLTLDDIKTPTPPVRCQPISMHPPRPKPIRNAEYLIP